VPTLTEDQRVDINNASQAELEKLPRIGKGIAEGIIKRRPYTSVDELRRVPGVGVKILDRLRPLITVRPPAEGTPGVNATAEPPGKKPAKQSLLRAHSLKLAA
jgi:type II secretory pathway component PulK